MDMAFHEALVMNAGGPYSRLLLQEFAHEASFTYEPGRYEILGPRDQALPTVSVIQDEYHSPSILGYKIRATYYHWLDKHPLVTAYLYEGTTIWLAPEYCRPVILPTGEARLWICFGCPRDEQHWGWITSDPCAAGPEKSEQWIKLSPIDWPLILPSADAPETEDSGEAAPIECSKPTKGDTQEVTDPVAPLAVHTLPTTTEARMPSSLFFKAITEMAASHSTTQRGKGDREGCQHNATSKSPARRVRLESSMALPMMRELQGINALNLEPALPEINDRHWPHDWQKMRQTARAVKGDRKDEFERSLEVINRSAVLPAGGGSKQRMKPPSVQKTQAKQTTGSSSAQHSWQ
jgi:hypothetical protein